MLGFQKLAAREATQKSHSRLPGLRGFAPLFWTAFLGALNDGLLAIGLLTLPGYHAGRTTYADLEALTGVAMVYLAPFLLFSAGSARLAGRCDKATVLRFVKSAEIGILLMGALVIWRDSAPLLYLLLFLMGVRATLFGPVKDTYLPQHLGYRELVGANSLVTTGTLIAIAIGLMAGSTLANFDAHGAEILGCTLVGVAVAGRVAAGWVPDSPALHPPLRAGWNPVSEAMRSLALARDDATVFLGLLGIPWLWFVGTTLLIAFHGLAISVLPASFEIAAVFLATMSVGGVAGALLCKRFARRRVELYFVLPSAIAVSVIAFDMYLASRSLVPSPHLLSAGAFSDVISHWRLFFAVFIFAMASALYCVPLHALLQKRSPTVHRARILGSNQMLSALAVIAAITLAMALMATGIGFSGIFLVAGLLNTLVSALIIFRFPKYLIEFVISVAVHAAYRVRAVHGERIPDDGAAVLVCNHVSFVDAFVIVAISPRPIRFVMSNRICQKPLTAWFFRFGRVIPIATGREDPALVASAYEECVRALAGGEVICIFPEGKRTPTGDICRFQPGVRKILRRAPVPVIPMALQGLWGSVFSRDTSTRVPRPMRKGARSQVTLAVGEPVDPANATPMHLQQLVEILHRAHYEP